MEPVHVRDCLAIGVGGEVWSGKTGAVTSLDWFASLCVLIKPHTDYLTLRSQGFGCHVMGWPSNQRLCNSRTVRADWQGNVTVSKWPIADEYFKQRVRKFWYFCELLSTHLMNGDSFKIISISYILGTA
jgi:hypothetical protein